MIPKIVDNKHLSRINLIHVSYILRLFSWSRYSVVIQSRFNNLEEISTGNSGNLKNKIVLCTIFQTVVVRADKFCFYQSSYARNHVRTNNILVLITFIIDFLLPVRRILNANTSYIVVTNMSSAPRNNYAVIQFLELKPNHEIKNINTVNTGWDVS